MTELFYEGNNHSTQATQSTNSKPLRFQLTLEANVSNNWLTSPSVSKRLAFFRTSSVSTIRFIQTLLGWKRSF